MYVYIRAMVKNDKGKPSKNRKVLKYGLIGLVSIFLLYNSFYVVSLDSRISKQVDGEAELLADMYLTERLPEVLASAPEPCALLQALTQEDADWEQYGKQTNIGNRYYFLVNGEGIVEEINDSFVRIKFGAGPEACSLRLATVYIFGNEIRDASGALRLEDVGELAKFNAISEIINKQVREQVVPAFLDAVQVGQRVSVKGAFALNKRLGITADFEVMPTELQIITE